MILIMKSNFLKKCLIYALMTAIIVVQKLILAVIPNFQFSTLLLVLFFYVFGTKPMLLITFLYVLVDNLWLGTIHIIYTPIMFVTWSSLVLLLIPFKKKSKNVWYLGLIGALHAVVYSFCFGLATALLYEIDVRAYIISDIPFTLILMTSNFLTIIWLFNPLYKVLSKYYQSIIIKNNIENACN